MSTGLPLYEGDGLIRSGRFPGLETLDKIEREARRMRSVTVWALLTRLADWAERRMWQARQRDVEQYLSQATDHVDLERRMRALDQGTRSTGI